MSPLLSNTVLHGDCIVVTRLNRPARSTRDLLNMLDTIAKAGAAFRSLRLEIGYGRSNCQTLFGIRHP